MANAVCVQLVASFAQGAGQKKIGDPAVGGWVGQSTKRGWDRIQFLDIFYLVFLLPSPRNAQKRDKKTPRKNGLGLLAHFFVKTFRHDFFVSRLFRFFLFRETPENATKKARGKTADFFGESF
jgi:hypothetical protein